MAKIYYQHDCNLDYLKKKTVAIIGYGSQGHAHARNLHDSGIKVVVGLYNGSKSWKKAETESLFPLLLRRLLLQPGYPICHRRTARTGFVHEKRQTSCTPVNSGAFTCNHYL